MWSLTQQAEIISIELERPSAEESRKLAGKTVQQLRVGNRKNGRLKARGLPKVRHGRNATKGDWCVKPSIMEDNDPHGDST